MKLLNKFLLIPISAIAVLSSAVYAANLSNNPDDYSLIALKNCQVVSESTLTQTQLNAYLSLKEEEEIMFTLQNPIKNIEGELKDFTDKIEEVTAMAVQETDVSIFIDKHYLKKQEELAEKINALVEAHQEDFDALEQQGKRIGKKARVLEQAIEAELDDLDYDQIRVITPGSNDDQDSCNTSIVMTRN